MGWAENPPHEFTPNCKIRILKPLECVYPELQPEVGKVYDAEYAERSKNYNIAEFCVVLINGKKICVRHDEFVLLELNHVER